MGVKLPRLLALALALSLAVPVAGNAAATLVIVNLDGPNEGVVEVVLHGPEPTNEVYVDRRGTVVGYQTHWDLAPPWRTTAVSTPARNCRGALPSLNQPAGRSAAAASWTRSTAARTSAARKAGRRGREGAGDGGVGATVPSYWTPEEAKKFFTSNPKRCGKEVRSVGAPPRQP